MLKSLKGKSLKALILHRNKKTTCLKPQHSVTKSLSNLSVFVFVKAYRL